ncbi:MAG: polymerase, sigma-24 subunit, subfamily [Paenibacillaceae bacterium]|jgi:RNA polymerase sigma-70 factor (ECF subfamily)|nr:polymerase, sigma-24 subunit, subfamily [Paenibacillaceae bacterium]
MESGEMELLAVAAREGDAEAFTILMREHKQQLYKMAYRYLGSEADALEAIQETTCRAYLRIGRLKEPRYFSTWLFRILINYCLDERKKRERRLRHGIPPELQAASEAQSSLSGESENRRLRSMVIDEAVGELEEHYQTVIQLKYYHDLTITEIARTLERPEGTIKTWLNKALKGLRARLDKEGESHV